MDITGSLGLYRYGQLVYRPKSPDGWIRAQYLHFQDDGHLTLYTQRYDTQLKSMLWTTSCVAQSAHKLVMTTDGDVLQLDREGRTIWSLLGSEAPFGNVEDARDTIPDFCFV
mmetsp:Transcript_52838/g.152327  ORF Transcript_52838/g.152327 Transcript_52838/m.152327 type:complete len:112 (+) Transcript_52838:316-651(+)